MQTRLLPLRPGRARQRAAAVLARGQRRALGTRTIGACAALVLLAATGLGSPASASAPKVLNVPFSIGTQRNHEGNDSILFTNHERFCVNYDFVSYEAGGRPDSNYGNELPAGKRRGFFAPSVIEGEKATMQFYRCHHLKGPPLATVKFVFERGYKYVPGRRTGNSASASAASGAYEQQPAPLHSVRYLRAHCPIVANVNVAVRGGTTGREKGVFVHGREIAANTTANTLPYPVVKYTWKIPDNDQFCGIVGASYPQKYTSLRPTSQTAHSGEYTDYSLQHSADAGGGTIREFFVYARRASLHHHQRAATTYASPYLRLPPSSSPLSAATSMCRVIERRAAEIRAGVRCRVQVGAATIARAAVGCTCRADLLVPFRADLRVQASLPSL
jgi:hypothetical protein